MLQGLSRLNDRSVKKGFFFQKVTFRNFAEEVKPRSMERFTGRYRSSVPDLQFRAPHPSRSVGPLEAWN